MLSSHGLYEIFILMQTHEKIPNSHRNTKHINYELVRKVQFTIAYHTTRSHLNPRGTSFMLCVLINQNPIFALCFGQPCIFASPLITRCLENNTELFTQSHARKNLNFLKANVGVHH
jgi:hypothetical protein